MRAIVKYAKGPGNIEIREVPKPRITKPDEVLIRINACGVCGTDLHILKNTWKNFPPVTIGHEYSGVIEEVGSAVTKWKVGDRVVAEPHSGYCGVCETCRRGQIQYCQYKRSPGWGIDGAFTDYMLYSSHFLHRIPDEVDDLVAALTEPMAIVLHEAVERGVVEPQDFVAVVGPGPIGILAAFAAKESGASKVAIIGKGKHQQRMEIAKQIGADYAINIDEQDPAEAIMELTDGKGADLVVEASGAESGINTAVDIVRRVGRITVIGIPHQERIAFKWSDCVHKVLDIRFNISSSYTSFDRSLSMMANTKYDLHKVITHLEPIDHWEQVFTDMMDGKGIKAMLVPDINRKILDK